jgi:hypothetical protein
MTMRASNDNRITITYFPIKGVPENPQTLPAVQVLPKRIKKILHHSKTPYF